MSSFDFALKDFYRKKNQTIPYLIIIITVVSLTEFLIYFTNSLSLNVLVQPSFLNNFFFSGSINKIFSQYNTLLEILLIILAIIIVLAISTTLIITKKKDIGIMRALGTLPRKLYSFYLLEVYVIFFFGFILGLVFGLIAFGIFSLIVNFLGFPIIFQIDLIYTPILFFSCLFGIFFIAGYTLRKIGKQQIIKTFSKDIPYNFDASKEIKFIPKWLSSLGFNVKISIINTLRRKGEFRRYLIVIFLISLIIFTLGLGTIVLRFSSETWIRKSQGENIIALGHKDVIQNYSLMYNMFSEPEILVTKESINFTNKNYFFDFNNISEIENIDKIDKIEKRIINFYDVQEIQGFHFFEDIQNYRVIGQNRKEIIPIIGVNPDNLIQNFEIEGKFFTNEDAFDNMTIGDGLALNFFDYALDQSLKLISYDRTFHISGVVIDSFYSGWAGYVSLDIIQQELNLTKKVNLVLLKINSNSYNVIKDELTSILNKLGPDFTHLRLDHVFNENLSFIFNLSIYPLFLIIMISIIGILSLYNYQKSSIIDKARDFLIMRAIGSKNKSLKKILFLESTYVIIPSLLLSLGVGMILNSIVLFARVNLPPLFLPLAIILILLGIFTLFNFLSLIPIMKKIDKFSIKDYNLY
ncbi:MAG: FtsX-like permease family protein [Promethearchaeota archaeon]